jgi:hypothetical protein
VKARLVVGTVLVAIVAALAIVATWASAAEATPAIETGPVQATELDTVVVNGDVKLAGAVVIERVPGGTVTHRAGATDPAWFEEDE